LPQQLRVDDVVATRTVETEVSRNVSIPTRLPPAERVVSVNARVELTDIDVERGYVVINGKIRATIFYTPADDPSNVVSLTRNFEFTDRVNIHGARPGLEAVAELAISDIDFSLVNERLINITFMIVSDVEITTTEAVPIYEDRPEIIRRQQFRIRRIVQERNFTRELESIVRLPTGADDIRRIIDVESSILITSVTTDYDSVIVRGAVNSNILYVNTEGQVEDASVSYGFRESFPFRGITPEMEAFVEARVIESNAEVVDVRRIRVTTDTAFSILVVREEIVEIPTDVTIPDRYPIRRTIIVERIVAEERTRVQEREQVSVPQGNPDVARVISVTGNIRGGSLEVETEEGGVLVSGVVDANIIYVADLPEQPVYFAPATITFSTFIEIPEVEEDMQAYADVDISRLTATRVSGREISVRAVLDVNLVVTERIRVQIITGIGEQPVEEPTIPTAYITYVVKPGDTLYLIAQRFGVTVNRLVEINNIANPDQIEVGQQLLIPRT